jgi:hypothetical protein
MCLRDNLNHAPSRQALFFWHFRGLQLLSLSTYFLNSCVLESMIPLSDLLVWISIKLYLFGVGFLHCADRNLTNNVFRHRQKLFDRP